MAISYRFLLIIISSFVALAPSFSQGAERCYDLFSVTSQQNKHAAYKRTITEFSDQRWKTSGQQLARIEVIQWYKLQLQEFVGSAKSIEDLRAVFLTIESTGFVDDQYQDAWRQVDFLSALRKKDSSQMESDDIKNLNETLETLMQESALPWTPIVEAFNVWEDPSYARFVVEAWIEQKPLLRDDFLYAGEHINMSLVNSLASVPQTTQKELLKLLTDSLLVIDAWIIEINAGPVQQKILKDPAREWQFVMQVLLRNELNSALDALPAVVTAKDLRTVERVFSRLHRHKMPYTFETVINVAKAIQSQMKPLLGTSDFVDIFGSFPNLSAKIGTSDIDILFSQRNDEVYYNFLNQTSANEPVSQDVFKLRDAALFADSVTAAENAVREILKSPQGMGEIFSVNLLTREELNGRIVIPQTLAQTETWFGMVNPLIIRVYSDRIVLRFWDGLSGTREIPARAREAQAL